jgi:hypothetical protein
MREVRQSVHYAGRSDGTLRRAARYRHLTNRNPLRRLK